MDLLAEAITAVRDSAAALVVDGIRPGLFRALSENEIASDLAALSDARRLVEAAMADLVGEIAARSEGPAREEHMTAHMGCHDVGELVQRVTRASAQTASRLQRAARAVRPNVSPTTGEELLPELPHVRQAMLDGVLGIDGVLAIAMPLLSTCPRVPPDARRHAEELIVAEARGDGPDQAPPLCADLLRLQAQVWATVLDQDGAEPRERAAMRTRAVTLGVATPEGVRIRGTLLPEVAAQLQTIFDAQLSPRTVVFAPDDESPDAPRDDRTRAQKQHDAFAAALGAAASSGLLPTVGGAAPTLVVSVTEEELASGRGYAHAQGHDEAISIDAARHIGCRGVIQRIASSPTGKIIRIGTTERVFNRHQRRAIALRDGNCVIPGCGVPAAWCEIHHVVEHAQGGPTHTDNGVLLCWFHHRFLDRSGWRIRMNRGVPEVRSPGWFDATLRWRAVTTSPTRLRTRVLQT
ncbi:MAG: DUF222 domain-containing protein [Microbacterium sp.]|uniref:HNH endonuclease signature motif containing protein n=1 Tax=Microbacterium sp. TaxID=51671 RepID=UPI0039E4B6C2